MEEQIHSTEGDGIDQGMEKYCGIICGCGCGNCGGANAGANKEIYRFVLSIAK